MLFERHHVSVQSDGTCSYEALVITFKLRFKSGFKGKFSHF